MEGSEKFCLRWNDYESNISDGLRGLRDDKDFFDVTLACEDNQVQAHRVIISACSPFFHNVLRRNPHQHPLLYLKGIKYRELVSILSFMYMGEVNVAQDELNVFLSVAEDLQVKGLTQNSGDSSNSNKKQNIKPEQPNPYNRQKLNQERVTPPQPEFKRQKVASALSDSAIRSTGIRNIQKDTSNEIEEISAVKTETVEQVNQELAFVNTVTSGQVHSESIIENMNINPVAIDESYVLDETFEYSYDNTTGYEDLAGMNHSNTGSERDKDLVAAREEEIMSLILKDSERKLFTCALCQFGASSRHKAFCHIESKHFQDSPVTYTCPFCGKTAQTKNAIGLHISRNHKHERGDSKNSLLFPKENSFY